MHFYTQTCTMQRENISQKTSCLFLAEVFVSSPYLLTAILQHYHQLHRNPNKYLKHPNNNSIFVYNYYSSKSFFNIQFDPNIY